MENGRFRKYRGGILLSAVLLVMVVSSLSLAVLYNHQNAVLFSLRTQKFYVAKTMYLMTWKNYCDLSEKERPKTGTVSFNTGTVTYRKSGNTLIGTVTHQEENYEFKKSISKEQKP